MEEMIEITLKEYEELKKCEARLTALEQYGVDNWDGYGDAMQSLEDDYED